VTVRKHDPFPALPVPTTINAEDISNLGNVTLRGDLRSYTWDGGGSLAGGADAAAAAGFFFDSSAGTAQLMGDVFVGGDINLIGLGKIQTAASGARVVLDATVADDPLQFFTGDADEEHHGSIWVTSVVVGSDKAYIIRMEPPSPNYNLGSPASPSFTLWTETDDETTDVARARLAMEGTANAGDPSFDIADGFNVFISDGFLEVSEHVRIGDGAAATPSLRFNGANSTGLYRIASTADMGITVNGTLAARLRSAGLLMVDGSAAAPPYSFSGRTDWGLAADGTAGLLFAVAGATQVSVGTAAGNGVRSIAVRDTTTGSAASVFINATSGLFARSTSALKYKEQVEDVDLADIDLRPTRHWRPDDEKFRYGLVADWLADQDPLLGEYGEDGQVESYDVRAVLAVLASKINRLEKELANA